MIVIVSHLKIYKHYQLFVYYLKKLAYFASNIKQNFLYNMQEKLALIVLMTYLLFNYKQFQIHIMRALL